MRITTASNTDLFGTTAVSLDVYSASYNASAFAGNSKSETKGVHVGTKDLGPFATWESMMKAIAQPGGDDLSVKGGKEKMQPRASATSVQLTYFGTVGVHPGEYGVTVNSEACPSQGSNGTLEFLFEIPSTDGRNASVEFLGNKEEGAGVYLLANC